MSRKTKQKFNPIWVFFLIILVSTLGWNLLGGSGTIQEVTWPTVKSTMLDSGAVSRAVVINNQSVEIYLKENKIEEFKKQARYRDIPSYGAQFEFRIGSLEKFENDFETAQNLTPVSKRVALEFEERKSVWGDLFLNLLPIIAIIAIWLFIFRGSRGGSGGSSSNVFNVGRAKAQVFDKEGSTKTTFKEVAGLEGAKEEIMEIVDFLRKPEKYKELGGKIPKGALLVGPPGTGKTLLAKAVAGEADVPFFSISGSDFVEMFVGVGASRVRDLFRQAKEKSPCIVFIDEIDAIGRARGKNSGFSSNDERENTLNQLLTEMDGFGTNAGVIILAATNRADILDKALLRAGRFDRQIHVDLPDLKEREEIFGVHLSKLKLDPALEVDFLAKQTPGFSGADIANVCNEAALIAARYDKTQVEKQDFLDAIDRIVGGLERKNKIMTPRERRTIAFHEAGHATVSWLLEYANPLIKVTIIPRGKALGAAWYLPEERSIITKEQMLHEMSAILGGRASEELNFNSVSSGALNDLERVTKQAYAMIAYYGMSEKVGNLSYFDSSGESAFTKPYSEKRAEEIDAEVKILISEAYEESKKILSENLDGLTQLANLLLEKEVVFAEDLERIFGKRKVSEPQIEDAEVAEDTEVTEVIEEAQQEESAQQIVE